MRQIPVISGHPLRRLCSGGRELAPRDAREPDEALVETPTTRSEPWEDCDDGVEGLDGNGDADRADVYSRLALNWRSVWRPRLATGFTPSPR